MDILKAKKLSDAFAKDLMKGVTGLNFQYRAYIYEELLEALFLHDVIYIPCFRKIKNQNIMNMDFEGIKKLHKVKFKSLGEKISNLYLENAENEAISEVELERRKNDLINIQEDFLFSLSKMNKDFPLKDLVEIHRVIISSIIENNFISINGEKSIEIKKNIEKEFLNIFGRHYRMLQCAKDKENKN